MAHGDVSTRAQVGAGRFHLPVFFRASPEFRPVMIPPVPQSLNQICAVVGSTRGSIMGTTPLDHRRYAEECVAMARLAGDDQDKMLWLTLAQSWVRLAEHVERNSPDLALLVEAE
jgi:hypothetical protein